MPMMRLEHLRGISDEECRRLRAVGILNSNQLIHATTLVIDRQRLSGKTGISEDRLLALGEQAELLEVSSIHRWVPHVMRLGITSISDLARQDPRELYERLAQIVGYGAAPIPSAVEYWVSQARYLDIFEVAEETKADRLRRWVPR
jgi:predicted amidohydrolase YtcJ